MEQNPKKQPEEEKSSGGRRYGLFGVSAYPEKSTLGEKQRASMARWAGGFTIVLAVLIAVLILVSSNMSGLTVTFDPQGGSGTQTQSIAYGGLVQEPDEVVRPGYTLVCWSLTPDGTRPWAFGTDTVTENITLYAVWEQSE